MSCVFLLPLVQGSSACLIRRDANYEQIMSDNPCHSVPWCNYRSIIVGIMFKGKKKNMSDNLKIEKSDLNG